MTKADTSFFPCHCSNIKSKKQQQAQDAVSKRTDKEKQEGKRDSTACVCAEEKDGRSGEQ